MADAWGNIIDEVHYYDTDPWPTEADGNGPYLELKDLNFDNSLAENWIAGNALLSINKFTDSQNIAIYPNPTSGEIHIALSENATHCQIIGLMGNVLSEIAVSSANFVLDLSGLPSGMYLVKVQFADGRTAYRKAVKQ